MLFFLADIRLFGTFISHENPDMKQKTAENC